MSDPRLHCHNSQNEQIICSLPDNGAIEKVSAVFQLISDPTRLKILLLLCHCEECVNNIAVTVNMSAPAVSHHLRLLKPGRSHQLPPPRQRNSLQTVRHARSVPSPSFNRRYLRYPLLSLKNFYSLLTNRFAWHTIKHIFNYLINKARQI